MAFKQRVNKLRRKVMRLLTRNIGQNTVPNSFSTESVKRILVSRPNSRLGNMLMVTPLLQEVSKTFPNAKVDLFVRSRIAPILFSGYSNIDTIITLPGKPFKQLLKYMRVWGFLIKRRYDFTINIEPGSSSGRLSTKLSKARYKLFCDMDEELETQYNDSVHMAKRPVYGLRKYLGYEPLDMPPIPPLSIRLNEQEIANGKKILDGIIPDKNKKTIGIYTFATGNKCYSPQWWDDTYKKLCADFGSDYNIMEVLPMENVSQIDFAAASFYSRDLREIAAVIDNLSVFLTADCGIMHLASATSTPVLGLFSITSPAKYCPYSARSVALEVTDIPDTNKMVAIMREILQQETAM